MISLNEWLEWCSRTTLRHIFESRTIREYRNKLSCKTMDTILYLNDNYRGGRTYVPDDQVYEPVTGSGLLF